jgi:hypothetical protein
VVVSNPLLLCVGLRRLQILCSWSLLDCIKHHNPPQQPIVDDWINSDPTHTLTNWNGNDDDDGGDNDDHVVDQFWLNTIQPYIKDCINWI